MFLKGRICSSLSELAVGDLNHSIEKTSAGNIDHSVERPKVLLRKVIHEG
jgi:hypothetical protein